VNADQLHLTDQCCLRKDTKGEQRRKRYQKNRLRENLLPSIEKGPSKEGKRAKKGIVSIVRFSSERAARADYISPKWTEKRRPG